MGYDKIILLHVMWVLIIHDVITFWTLIDLEKFWLCIDMTFYVLNCMVFENGCIELYEFDLNCFNFFKIFSIVSS
jgi:hypothetical protein